MTSSPSRSVMSFAVQVRVSCENGFAGSIETLPITGAEFPKTTIAVFVAVPSSLSTTVEVQVSSSPVLLFSSVRRSVLSEPSSVPS